MSKKMLLLFLLLSIFGSAHTMEEGFSSDSDCDIEETGEEKKDEFDSESEMEDEDVEKTLGTPERKAYNLLSPESKRITRKKYYSPYRKVRGLRGRAGEPKVLKHNKVERRKARRNLCLAQWALFDSPSSYPKLSDTAKEVLDMYMSIEASTLGQASPGSLTSVRSFSELTPRVRSKILELNRMTISPDGRTPSATPSPSEKFRLILSCKHIFEGTKKGGCHFYPEEGLVERDGVDPICNTDTDVYYGWPLKTSEPKTLFSSTLTEDAFLEALKESLNNSIAVHQLKVGTGSYIFAKPDDQKFPMEIIAMSNVDGTVRVLSAYPIFSFTHWDQSCMNRVATICNGRTGDTTTLEYSADKLKGLARDAIHNYIPHYTHDHPVRYQYGNDAGVAMTIVDIGLKLRPFGFPLRGVYVEIPTAELGLSEEPEKK